MGIRTVLVAMAAFVLSACATVYEAENFDEYQTAHKTVAILPFTVIAGNDSYTNRINKDLAKKQLKVEGKMLQSRMYSRFKKMLGMMPIRLTSRMLRQPTKSFLIIKLIMTPSKI